MDKLLNIQKKIEVLLVYLAGTLLIMLMLVVSVESILRKFANYSIPGIFEISSQLMVGVTILGISYVQGEKEHIAVDIMNKVFPSFILKLTDLLSYSIGFVIASVFSYQGLLKFLESFQNGETAMGIVSIPFWPGRLAIFLAMFLLAIRFAIDIIVLVTQKQKEPQNIIEKELEKVPELQHITEQM
ncbi:TRAP transporter small permease [Solibacillus sp. FSL R7-0668]|uniref:TRAP transporter small permease n=1 Tax=Solibacillus sp. FSL R7-0668 TaxID=2921688 RepID=UPI0030FBDAC5